MLVIIAVAFGAIFFVIGYSIRSVKSEAAISAASEDAAKLIDGGLREAEKETEEFLHKAKGEISRRRQDFELEDKEQRSLIQTNERRLQKKSETLAQKQEYVAGREAVVAERERELNGLRESIDGLICQRRHVLEELSGLTTGEAREVLLDKTVQETRYDLSQRIKRSEADIKEIAGRRAAGVISAAIQRCSGGHVDEPETPPVFIPSDDVKAKLIGREGKHIRLLQTLTGVEWAIDAERQVLVFSSPDSVKREIARNLAQRLIAEHRLHPQKIEDIYEKVKREINARIFEEGTKAAAASGVKGLHPDVIRLLGRMRFRTSYGQNVLTHSVEVALLSGGMASEIGANAVLARRAGLLHDIGKAMDHEIEGSHVLIGVDIAKQYGEGPQVINCIAAHHGDVEFETIEASLVSSADTLSAGRPGARRETLESYIKRVEALENMASSFEGVDKAYAIHAGREVRVLVKPDKITDVAANALVKKVAKKFEDELEYPGQIKVVVVRETRAVDYAK